jgi:hypothetical protein
VFLLVDHRENRRMEYGLDVDRLVFLLGIAISFFGAAAAGSSALIFFLVRSVAGRYARRQAG